jgi:eukaryotic-like serine/threonine-protein kinase
MQSAEQVNRFEVRGRLGAGGMGVVHRAYDHRLGREVALKTLRHAQGRDLYRFKREFRALTDIVHPNLVVLHELRTAGDDWFFTMELIEGVTFLEWVRDQVASNEPTVALTATPGAIASSPDAAGELDRSRLDDALAQLVDGVLALHVAGKLHRDLKPSNVLVTGDGRVVLLDFGLVSSVGTAMPDVTHEAAAVGTPAYMSPEQAADEPLTEASDWYSVGVMLYEALTGRRPFEGAAHEIMRRKQAEPPRSPAELAPHAPPHLAALCMQLLSREPSERPDGREILARLGRSPSRATLDLERSQTATPFIGRAAELRVLRGAYEGSRRHAVAVFVRGDSGMGKSQLVRRFLEDVPPQALVLEGRCYERESVPYKTLDTVIDALTSALLRLTDERLDAAIPRDVAALARLFPVLRRIPALDARTVGASLPLDPQEVLRRAFTALRAMLRALTASQPVIVVIDDLQWGDADSAAFVSELIHHPESVPLLLVLIHRLEDDAGVVEAVRVPAPGLPVGDARTLDVGPLDADEARRLLRALGRAEDDTSDQVVREGGGHPLFLAELARASHSQRGGEALHLDALIGHRIAALPPAAATLLRALALATRPLPAAQAARAAGLPALGSELPLLVAERLARVRRRGDVELVEPYHDRVRSAAVASLDAGEQRRLHEALARTFEIAGDTVETEGLIEHWLSAGHPERAAAYAVDAARGAEDKLAFHRAAQLYALALCHGGGTADERRHLQRQRAAALANAGALEAAADAYAEAAVGASPDEGFDLLRLRIEQILRRGELAQGLALSRELLASVGVRLPLDGPAVLRAALYERVQLRLRGLRFVERPEAELPRDVVRRIDALYSTASGLGFVTPIAGKVLQFRFLREALDAGEPHRIANAMSMEMAYVASTGVTAARRVDALASQLSRVSARNEHPGLAGFATACEGLAFYLMGQWRAARRAIESGMNAMVEHGVGLRWETNLAEQYLTSTLYYLGETAQLARLVPQYLRDATARGDVYAQHALRGWRSNLAWLVMDRPDEARSHADAAARARRTVEGFHLQHYYELLSMTQIDLYQGDPASAWQRLEDAWKTLTGSYLLRIQSVRVEASFLRARVAVAAAAVQPGAAPSFLAEARRLARRLDREGAPWASAFAEHVRALVAAVEGHTDADQLLERAERSYAAADMSLFASVVRLRRGQHLGGITGAAWEVDARKAMAGQAIANIDAMAQLLSPRP